MTITKTYCDKLTTTEVHDAVAFALRDFPFLTINTTEEYVAVSGIEHLAGTIEKALLAAIRELEEPLWLKTYEGYSNFETWLVCLTAGNDRTINDRLERLVAAGSKMTRARAMFYARDFWSDGFPSEGQPFDYKKVNWTEVAIEWSQVGK